MKYFLSLILGALFVIPAIGQGTKLEGTVRDAETGETMVGVTVVLYQKGGVVKGAMTDLVGYFSFDAIAQGVYDIEFRVIGFETLRTQVDHKSVNRLDVQLHAVHIPGPGLIIQYRPPFFDMGDTTQGHVFKMEDIRHSPVR
jgi:hypothetical protein